MKDSTRHREEGSTSRCSCRGWRPLFQQLRRSARRAGGVAARAATAPGGPPGTRRPRRTQMGCLGATAQRPSWTRTCPPTLHCNRDRPALDLPSVVAPLQTQCIILSTKGDLRSARGLRAARMVLPRAQDPLRWRGAFGAPASVNGPQGSRQLAHRFQPQERDEHRSDAPAGCRHEKPGSVVPKHAAHRRARRRHHAAKAAKAQPARARQCSLPVRVTCAARHPVTLPGGTRILLGNTSRQRASQREPLFGATRHSGPPVPGPRKRAGPA